MSETAVPPPAHCGWRDWRIAVVLAVAAAAYRNALENGLVWDDVHLIVQNPLIKNTRNWARLFASDLFAPVASHYYRPAQALSYLFDYAVWGLSPFGFHLTSVVLHALVAAMLFCLARRLCADQNAALVAALLFAVHPVHSEAVAYVSGRSDPLSALALLVMLSAALRAGDRLASLWRLLSLGAFALALLSRESAMIGGALLILVDVWARRGRAEPVRARLVLAWSAYGVVLALYLLVRSAVVGAGAPYSSVAAVPLLLRLATMLGVIVQYLALFVLPLDLHMERMVYPAASPLEPAVLGAAALLAGLVLLARRAGRAVRMVPFGVLWFLIALVPVANVFPLATFMAEHWLYVPSMGLCVALGALASQLAARGWSSPVASALVVLVAAYGALTIRRNAEWRDALTIYAATVHAEPRSVRAWANLGQAQQERGELAAAEESYRRAIALGAAGENRTGAGGELADPHNNLGNIYRDRGQYEAAVSEFLAALSLNPAHVVAYNNLALTYEAMGRSEEARTTFEAALRIHPEWPATHSNLGNHFFRAGDLERARREYESAIALNPDYAEAYNNLGSVQFRLGQPELAEQSYERALALDPGLVEVRRNLEIVRRSRR